MKKNKKIKINEQKMEMKLEDRRVNRENAITVVNGEENERRGPFVRRREGDARLRSFNHP